MATGVQTGNSFCLLDQMVTDQGGGPCTHSHTQDEGLYVVSGHCTFQAGGETVSAGAGSFVSVPHHTEHSFVVDQPGTQLLNFYLPAGFELFLMGIAHPAERNELPPHGVALPPPRLVEQLSRDYGQIAGPFGLPGIVPPRDDNMVTKPKQDATALPFRSDAGNAPAYWHAGGLWSVLADGAATDGSYCLLEQVLPAGPAAPPHLHMEMDEMFYVLDGEVEFLLGDRRATASKGSLAFIPRGTLHGFQVGAAGARLLNLYTPAGFERSVTTLGGKATALTLPPVGWNPPEVSPERRRQLFGDIGMRVLALADPFGPA